MSEAGFMKNSTDQDGAAFAGFAETAESIAATTKRNEKAALLGRYLATLADADLALAARFFSGQIFALWDQRTTNVGGSALLTAMSAVTRMSRDDITARLVARGDLGDVAYDIFEATGGKRQGVLSLEQVSAAFEQLAATSGSKLKTALLAELLSKAGPVEAKYVVKLLVGDLRIGLKEGSVEDAVARLHAAETGQVQWANMLTGDIGETALLARRGRLADARMRLFHPIKFMLATPAADLKDVEKHMPEQFVVEDKFDGIRAQAHISRTPRIAWNTRIALTRRVAVTETPVPGVIESSVRVALFSRTLDEITPSFPDLVAPLAALVGSDPGTGESSLILDGEIVPIKNGQILPFLALQKRLGRKKLPEELLADVPAAFVAFDALYGDGRVLIGEPLSARRQVLDSLEVPEAGVRRAASRTFTNVTDLDGEFAAARARGNEGLMVKNPGSAYKPGRRGRDWLKIKRADQTLDVVVTAVEVGNGRRSSMLSDYTFAVRASESDSTLLNVGKAYSGLTDAEINELSEWFRAHTIKEFAHGKVRIVEPRIVIEVTFDLVQKSNRHKSGYALRFPRILRIRTDKPPEEIDTLDTVQRLADPASLGTGLPSRRDGGE
jgi:DNA ligase-1